MKDMKIDFPVYILHALHVLHGKIKYSMLEGLGKKRMPQILFIAYRLTIDRISLARERISVAAPSLLENSDTFWP